MRFAFMITLFAALSLRITPLVADEPELFSVLKADDDVYSMDLTEDQKLLVLAHKDADRVTIWDILTNKEVGSIDTPAPAFVLCRGTRIYVANCGHGLVTVFDGAKKWEKIAEVKTGVENVAVLAAPGGRAFTGQLLGLCDLSAKEKQMIFIDMVKKRSAPMGKGDFAGIAVDFDGKAYFWQVNGGSPARYIPGIKSWPLLLSGRDSPQLQGMMDTLPILRQVQTGTFWFGGNRVSKGMPPAFVGDARGQFVIGDRSKQLGYALLTEDKGHYLDAFELKGSLNSVGKRLIQFPKEYKRFDPKIYANPHVTHLHDFQNIAVTGADGQLRIYVYECFDKLVWKLTTAAFAGEDVRGQKAPLVASNQPEKPPLDLAVAPAQNAAPADNDFRTWTDPRGKRRSVPEQAEQSKAKDLLREIYRDEFSKAIKIEQKLTLAGKMLTDAIATNDAPVERYVLLKIAGDQAATLGSADLSMRALREVARDYEVDGDLLRLEAVEKLAGSANEAESMKTYELSQTLAEKLSAADRYSESARAAAAGLQAAKRTKSVSVIKGATAQSTQAAHVAKEYDNARAAAATLNTLPTDKDANLVMGKFYCFAKQDWNRGLPMLALGNDAELAKLGIAEIAADSPAQRVACADQWLDLSENSEGLVRAAQRRRAYDVYRANLQSFSGVSAKKIETRLALLAEEFPDAVNRSPR